MIVRREFITLLGGAAAAWPLAVHAEQAGKVWRIGWLAGNYVPSLPAALAQGMRELGYVERKDFVIEWRSVEGNYERIAEVAAELVQLKGRSANLAPDDHYASNRHGLLD